jgi:outer membrane protein insertion porin family
VRGNFKTHRWVVRDNFDLHTGDLFSTEALEKGRTNLRTTGLFTTVRTDVYPPPDRPGHDPQSLILEVGERYDRLADLDVGVGFSTDNSLFGSLTVAMRNLAGIGIALSATGELGLLRTSVQSSLVFPEWVMRRAIALAVRLELQARYRVDQTPRFGSLTTLGFTVSFSRQLAQGILLSLKYDWNRFGRSTELLRPAGNDQEITATPIDTTTALLGPTLLIDRRDNPLAPSRGYFVTASVGLASTALLGTDDFWKLNLLGQVFAPLGGRVVLANSLRWDQGFPLGGSVLLPEVERFSAGGDTTVRGYDTDRLATEIIRNPLAPASDAAGYRVVPIGRNIRVIHRLDLQLRLFDRFLGSIDIASAVFLDSGLLTNSFADFDVGQIRQGLGLGLRIISAAGVISVEYAFPLQPRLGDDPTGRPDLLIGITL